ncbi:MAG TPA: response regulator transcription factor [Oculatellaceae cyanobacterium]
MRDTNQRKILLVEDSEEQAVLVQELLEDQGYLVDAFTEGVAAELQLRNTSYDLLILDWQIDPSAAIEICRYFRATFTTAPIIVLTNSLSNEAMNSAVAAGATDYLIKPFSFKEMLAKVRGSFVGLGEREAISLRGITIDLRSFGVFRNGSKICLLPKEFALLEFFMRNPNQVVTSETLIHTIWKSTDSSTNALRSTLRRLRRKLGESSDTSVIENIHGIGYRLMTTES